MAVKKPAPPPPTRRAAPAPSRPAAKPAAKPAPKPAAAKPRAPAKPAAKPAPRPASRAPAAKPKGGTPAARKPAAKAAAKPSRKAEPKREAKGKAGAALTTSAQHPKLPKGTPKPKPSVNVTGPGPGGTYVDESGVVDRSVSADAASVGLTSYGSPLTQENIAIIQDLLSQARVHGLSTLEATALIYSANGESEFQYEIDNGGPLQTTCDLSAYNGGRDVKGQADGWITGGTCFGHGSGPENVRLYGSAWQAANATEDNAVWSQSGGDSYARSGMTTDGLTSEAENIVAYYYNGKHPTSTAGGTTRTGIPNTLASGTLTSQIEGFNWAGGPEDVIKSIMGGSNQAAHMATTYAAGLQKLSYVQPTKKG